MKNKLIDLNNHLFEQMERLNDDDLTDEQLKKEVSRARAMEGLATNIIDNAKLALESQKFIQEYGYEAPKPQLPEMLEQRHEKVVK
ncbi:hypothetical protein B5F14_06475 [Faecalitalea cylindroides]|jgi:hypothetical protein|uniref:Phage protein n=1 Tax=Faecalitalea cylindroides TaxID=39483 RepID=A0A1Y4LWP9_9FIRM|nr:hypothetical protein [Faecalitalea cylindroides]OUP60059.1 hypothetical protein B5F14_06475 [Faecalitalea cylindroides]